MAYFSLLNRRCCPHVSTGPPFCEPVHRLNSPNVKDAGWDSQLAATYGIVRFLVFGTQNLLAFVAAGILLNITPGQDTFYILGRSIAQGRRAGVLSALGIATGGLAHVTAAAVGLSALIASSAYGFTIVKWVGAAYLIFLGIQMLRDKSSETPEMAATSDSASTLEIYLKGVLTNLLNPKVALFFLAFLPQFVVPDSPNKVASFLFLGSLFLLSGTTWCVVLAVFAARIARGWRSHPRKLLFLRRVASATFVALGCRLATERA